MSWMAIATVGSAAIQGGSAYMASKNQKGGGGGLMEWTAPQYSFTEPRLNQTSDYISNAMSRLGRGEYPAYYERAVPKIRDRAMNNLYQTYFGNPGNRRGAYNMALETGAVQGVGARPAYNRAQGMMNDYTNQSQQIDQFLEQEGINIMKESSFRFPELSMKMPMGPESQAFQYQEPQSGGEGWGMFGDVMGKIDPEMIAGGLGKMFPKKSLPYLPVTEPTKAFAAFSPSMPMMPPPMPMMVF